MPKYTNKGIKVYTPEQKAAYYARKANKARMYGQGSYKIGRPYYIKGKGAYKIPWKNLVPAADVGGLLGSAAGAAIGSVAPGIGTKLGTSIGSTLGREAGKLFKSITGWGDYNIRENSILFPDRVVPSFGEDTIRVRKREYITSINASTAFANNSFPINPGLNDTFPWLASIANNYEQYRFNGLVFQFVSTSSDAIASTTDLGLGQVILATDYNSADHPFINAPQMLGSMFSNSGKPSENIMHAIECAPTDVAQKLYYVRSGDAPEGTDIRLYDLGLFQLATQNMPAAYNGMGQLWVTYDITFCKSVQNNQLGFDINTDHFQLSGVTDSAMLGTQFEPLPHSNLGCTLSNNLISFPITLESGYFMVTMYIVGGSVAITEPNFTGTNCSVISAWLGDSISAATNTGTTSTIYLSNRIWKIEGREATIALSGGSVDLPSSSTGGDLIITQVNGEIYDDL